jgi:hypothetical protein
VPLAGGIAWFKACAAVQAFEPWGRGLAETFALAIRVGAFTHSIAWTRQRDALPPEARPEFDRCCPIVVRRALARTIE